MDIDIELARKVLSVVDAGLVKGMGSPEPGQMCVEAAVNYAMGAPHGDEPACVAPSLRRLKIRLNDAAWSSDKARAAGLRRLAIAQLGSAGVLDEKQFAVRCAQLAIQTCVPASMRAAAGVCKEPYKTRMLAIADRCERQPIRANAIEAKDAAAAAANAAADAAYAYAAAADVAAAYAAANAAADAAYAYAAADAAYADADAAYAAANAAANVADAVAYAAAAYVAAADAAYVAAAYAAAAYAAAAYVAAAVHAARDKSLASFAEGVVQILIDMKAPGCEFLYLTETITPYFARPS